MAHLIARGQYRKTVEIQMQLYPMKSNTAQHWIVSLIANQLWREGKIHSSWPVTSRWPPIWRPQCAFCNSFNKSLQLTVREKIIPRIIRRVQSLELDASVVFIVYYYNNTIIRGCCTAGLAGRLFLHTFGVSTRRLQTSNWRLKHIVLEFSRVVTCIE